MPRPCNPPIYPPRAGAPLRRAPYSARSAPRRLLAVLPLTAALLLPLLHSVSALSAENPAQTGASPESAPPAFTAENQKELDAAKARLEAIRQKILTAKLTPDESAALAAERRQLTLTIADLEARKKRYEAWLAGTGSAQPSDAAKAQSASPAPPAWAQPSQFPPESPSTRVPEMRSASLETGVFALLARFDSYELRLKRKNNPPSAKDWEDLAARFATHAMTSFSGQNDPASPYVLRAALLQGQCLLYASEESLRAGDATSHLAFYEKGLDTLQQLMRRSRGFSESSTGYLPGLHQDAPDGTFWYVGYWQPPGEPRLRLYTQEMARRTLAEYCPWGIEVYRFLKRTGFTNRFDWKILKPYGGHDPSKLSETGLSDLPLGVRQDGDSILGGKMTFRGQPVIIEWAVPPKASYTLWFLSPVVYEKGIAEAVTWALRAVKLIEGPLGLLIDEVAGFLLGSLSDIRGPDDAVYASCGYVNDLRRTGLLTSDFTLSGNVERVPYKFSRSVVTKSISYLESAEAGYLFESANPRDKALSAVLGQQIGYAGGPIPPIVIRADFLGFLKTAPHKYRRTLHLMRYYRLDPRALAGTGEKYDLLESPIDALPRAEEYLRGDVSIQSSTWKELPNDPKPLGTRAFITDFSPKGQTIHVNFPPKTLARWREEQKDLKVESDLVAILCAPEPYDTELARQRIDGDDALFWLFNMAVPEESQPYNLRPREGVRWLADELYNQYRVRVGFAPRDGKGVVTRELEKESIEVSFLPGATQLVVGTLSAPHPGWFRIDFLREDETSAPEGSRLRLLPPILRVERLDAASQTLRCMESPWHECRIDIALAPVDPGWHKITIDAGGRKYYAWDRVDRLSAAAVFSPSLPLPPGETKITVSAEGARAVTFKAVRDPVRKKDDDIRRALESISTDTLAAQKAYDDGKTGHYYALLHHLLEHYEELSVYQVDSFLLADARKSVNYVFENFPTDAQAAQAEMKDPLSAFRSLRAEALRISSYLSLYEGNAKRMKEDSLEWCKIWRAENRLAFEGKDKAKYYTQLADRYGTLLTRMTLLGSSQQEIRSLELGEYVPTRKAAGYYEEAYDKFTLRYGQDE